jgi:hypothetical protein
MNKLPTSMVVNGILFGYPKCCIDAFIKRSQSMLISDDKGKVTIDPLTEEQSQAHGHTGFIPCPSCATKLVENDKPVESLITHRMLKKKPFPEIDTKEFYDLYAQLTKDSAEEKVELKWYWFSFSLDGKNQGVFNIEAYNEWDAYREAQELGLIPDYDDIELTRIPEQELKEIKRYSPEELYELGYGK